MINTSVKVGDEVIVGRRQGKVIKVLEKKSPSPGGFVVENELSIFYVAPWERFILKAK